MQLDIWQAKEVERIRGNLAEYHRRRRNPGKSPDFYAEWAGVFEVNVEVLLECVDRLAAPPLVPSGTGWPVP